jgi:hypothetical protein
MKRTCEANVDERIDAYRPCGKPACTWERDEDGGKVWMCAEHYDELMTPGRGPSFPDRESFLD